MAKSIEQIIEESVVPEMEYVKPKHKSISYEVPEVVLPKTKAEEYREAKDRLDQQTSAVSKAYEKQKTHEGGTRAAERRRTGSKPKDRDRSDKQVKSGRPEKKVKTVELDSAAAAAAGAASIAEQEDMQKLKTRLNNLKKIVEAPKWVGGVEELIPFAWRYPLIPEIRRPSKFYKAAIKADKMRADLLPTLRKE